MASFRPSVVAAAAASLTISTVLAGVFDLPKLPPPDRYGTVVIDRLSTANNVKPVVFSHWRHRARYSCRVCHFELGFEFETNATEITEKDNRHGLFCGACHNGKEAFAHEERTCERCHAGKVRSEKKAFHEFRRRLPDAPFGNEIDWMAAQGDLEPRYAFFKDEKPLDYTTELQLEAEWFNIPPAVFPHGAHVQLLDCANCHPDVFNIKKKTTEHFEMRFILEGRFCGACHLTVAFPLNDCMRCHPAMHRNP